jgi:glycosyltransferase involved in cell wall biosynthesis
VLKLLKWLHADGYNVILAIPVESVDSRALQELLKITYAVHWTKPAPRTRLGRRFPTLRKIVWERIKPFLSPPMIVSSNLDERPSSLGSHELKKGICPEALIHLVGKLSNKYRPQAIIAEYVFMTPCFANLPADTLRVLDTIDVLSRKKDQVLAFGIADPFACTEDEERQYLLQADVIVAIQAREAEILKSMVPERNVILTSIDFDTSDVPVTNENSNTILMIGNDNELNIHGLQSFLKECWQEIKNAHPAVRLHIVGKVGAQCSVDDSSVYYTPSVNDLGEIYRSARLAINPTIAGTGLKIKSAEALAHGKPLVAWPNGVEGLEYAGEAPYIECRSWQEFGSAVVRILRSDSEATRLANRARSYAHEQFSASKVYASLGACLIQHTSRSRTGTPAQIVPEPYSCLDWGGK